MIYVSLIMALISAIATGFAIYYCHQSWKSYQQILNMIKEYSEQHIVFDVPKSKQEMNQRFGKHAWRLPEEETTMVDIPAVRDE